MALATWWSGDPLPALRPLPNLRTRETADTTLQARLAALGPAEVASRLADDHRSYVASLDQVPVAYGWAAGAGATIGELGVAFTLPRGDPVYLGDESREGQRPAGERAPRRRQCGQWPPESAGPGGPAARRRRASIHRGRLAQRRGLRRGRAPPRRLHARAARRATVGAAQYTEVVRREGTPRDNVDTTAARARSIGPRAAYSPLFR